MAGAIRRGARDAKPQRRRVAFAARHGAAVGAGREQGASSLGSRSGPRRLLSAQVNVERTMDRRHFLKLAGSVPLVTLAPELMAEVAWGATTAGADYRKLLLLIELKGGNDGLNTLVPYANPTYYALRTEIAIAREQVVQQTAIADIHR